MSFLDEVDDHTAGLLRSQDSAPAAGGGGVASSTSKPAGPLHSHSREMARDEVNVVASVEGALARAAARGAAHSQDLAGRLQMAELELEDKTAIVKTLTTKLQEKEKVCE